MENVRLLPATTDHLETIYKIQQEAFQPLLEKYADYDINPAMESPQIIRRKMEWPKTDSYIFKLEDTYVGWVRIINVAPGTYKVSALSVIPQYQNKGIAQAALKEIESKYPSAKKWVLDTILQERGNCYLYEKLGYVRVGEPHVVNENITLINYEKQISE
jgi:GNAT superfamily N-acetyltransferase